MHIPITVQPIYEELNKISVDSETMCKILVIYSFGVDKFIKFA